MASSILQNYINWGIIGPDQLTNVNDIDWTGPYQNFKQKLKELDESVDTWYLSANLTEEDEFYTVDAYNEWKRNRDIFSYSNNDGEGVAEIMWESLIGKSLTQEQYNDYISALSNMMQSLKLLFMVVDRDPFTEPTVPTPTSPDGFKTLWRCPDSTQIVLPLPPVDNSDTSLIYNFTVYWGDGTSNTITSYDDSDITHTYTTSGDKTVTIVGDCEGWSFDYQPTSCARLTQVLSWGDPTLFSGFKYLRGGFSGASNLTSLPDGSDGYGSSIRANGNGCSSFELAFSSCSSLESIPTGLFDSHSLVTTFQNAFNSCQSLTSIPVDLFRYNVNVINFAASFYNCQSLTSIPSDLFKYNVNVQGFSSTFANCIALTSIPIDKKQ
jgi:hypothetical protein